MKKNNLIFFVLVTLALVSCVSANDVRYLQENENLMINEEGLIPYSTPEYRITKNDILKLNIITTPNGKAARFYSAYNTSGGKESSFVNSSGAGLSPSNGSVGGQIGGRARAGNPKDYFNSHRVNLQGEISVFGIGLIKVEGRTLEDVEQEIQQKVNEEFLEGKTQVRLNTDGITYYILGDVESVKMTGEKKAYVNTLTITQALAMNGGLDRSVDRTNIKIIRKFPEGMKEVKLDLTRGDTMNSPYFWVQNGDEIHVNTRKKNLNGFGKNPIQTLTTGVSLLTTGMSIYLILSRL